MEIFYQKKNLKNHLSNFVSTQKKIGFVPTMGALHEGHLALVKKAHLENHLVVVSIFVNPTQFEHKEDLEKYPRTLQTDLKKLENLCSDIIVYHPKAVDIYDGKVVAEKFDFDGLEFEMEGDFRKGFFYGVGTVIKKLLEIVTPTYAYFGEKDFQQLQIVKKMVQKYNIPTKIRSCPIYREPSGLAMSSRNERLSLEGRKEAAFIYEILQAVKIAFRTENVPAIKKWVTTQFCNKDLLELEYIEIADIDQLKSTQQKQEDKKYRAFIAVYIENIRLIDNISLN